MPFRSGVPPRGGNGYAFLYAKQRKGEKKINIYISVLKDISLEEEKEKKNGRKGKRTRRSTGGPL